MWSQLGEFSSIKELVPVTEPCTLAGELWYNPTWDGSFLAIGHYPPEEFAAACAGVLRREGWTNEDIQIEYPGGFGAERVGHLWVLEQRGEAEDTWYRTWADNGAPVTAETPGALALTKFYP